MVDAIIYRYLGQLLSKYPLHCYFVFTVYWFIQRILEEERLPEQHKAQVSQINKLDSVSAFTELAACQETELGPRQSKHVPLCLPLMDTRTWKDVRSTWCLRTPHRNGGRLTGKHPLGECPHLLL